RRRGQAEPLLEHEQALVHVVGDLEPGELAFERVAGERLADLGGGERAPLGLLDPLGHAVEGLEGGAVGEARHGFVDPLLRLRALLLGDEEVLLALGLLDLVVQLAQRILQLLRLHRLALPRLLERGGALGVLLLPQQRLAREVAAARSACSGCRRRAWRARSSRPSRTASPARCSHSAACLRSSSTCALSLRSSAMATATSCVARASCSRMSMITWLRTFSGFSPREIASLMLERMSRDSRCKMPMALALVCDRDELGEPREMGRSSENET